MVLLPQCIVYPVHCVGNPAAQLTGVRNMWTVIHSSGCEYFQHRSCADDRACELRWYGIAARSIYCAGAQVQS